MLIGLVGATFVIRAGILSITQPWKGLWRDAESLMWALDRECPVSLFPIEGYGRVEANPVEAQAADPGRVVEHGVPPGVWLEDWFETLDVVIVCECLMPRTFDLARRHGVRVVYVPNWEWTEPQPWVEAVMQSGAQVWAKTGCVARRFRAAGLPSQLVPWSIPDPVRNRRPAPQQRGPVRFFINAGRGGWGCRRGLDLALRAFAQAQERSPELELIVKTLRPLAEFVPPELLDLTGVEVVEGFMSRESLAALQEQCDCVLHPSRWEGFGLPMLEALHAGLPVIATDGAPMSELIRHEQDGLLVTAWQAGELGLAPRWECDVDVLAEAMIRLAGDLELRQRLAGADLERFRIRQREFVSSAISSLSCLR